MEYRRSLLPAVVAVLVVASFFLVTFGTVIAEASDRDEPSAVLEGEGPKPTVTPYYLKGLSGAAVVQGTLSPAGLNESGVLGEVTVNGPMFPRFLINNVGSWTMYVGNMPLVVYGVNYACVWAKSNEDVQGAQFRIHLRKNGQTIGNSMSTPAQTLSSAPMEFTATDPPSFATPVTFIPGDSLSVFIQYTARSRYPFGPAPGCTVLMGTLFHASRVELNCIPMEMNVSTPVFNNGLVGITGKIIDTSDIDPQKDLLVNLDIISSGKPMDPSTIERMNFVPKDDSIIVNWTWDWKKSQVTDGLFEFRIDVSYGVYGINYTNSTFYELEFPKQQQREDFVAANMSLIIGIVVVAVLAAVGAFLYIRRTRQAYPPGYYGPRGPPPGRAPKPKKAKPSRAERKAMKKGLPPPVGPPPSPDRTPMPGKAPPGGRPVPKGAPPQPRGAPQATPMKAPPRPPR